METYKAHIFKQRRVGMREEVKLRLFDLDGLPLALGGGIAEFAYGISNGPYTPPVGSEGYPPLQLGESNTDSLVKVSDGIEIHKNGLYLVAASGFRPSNVGVYGLQLVLDDYDGWTTSFGSFESYFQDVSVEGVKSRWGFVWRAWEEENQYEIVPKLRLRTDSVTGSPTLSLRHMIVVKLGG